MIFLAQQKVAFAGLEENFYFSAMPINPDDVIFIQAYICADNSNPVFTVVSIAYTYYACTNFIISTGFYSYRQ